MLLSDAYFTPVSLQQIPYDFAFLTDYAEYDIVHMIFNCVIYFP
jgi:hypothetical protein